MSSLRVLFHSIANWHNKITIGAGCTKKLLTTKPLYTMTPVFIGGMIRHFVEKKYGADKDKTEKGKDQGILLGSGLIAGEGLMGVVIAVIAVIISKTPKYFEIHWSPHWVGEIVSIIFFTILGMFLYSVAARSRRK